MAYYITEPLGGSDDVVVSVYKNTGEYVGNIIVDRYKWRMSSDEETRYSIGQFKAENAESRNPSYDCGENVELFKALAAMNDENDYMQWYVNEITDRWSLCIGMDHVEDDPIISKWEGLARHKATAEEIIKHFKK